MSLSDLNMNVCLPPFLDEADFADSHGFVSGRLCSQVGTNTTCCLPCPMTQWVYPDSFETLGTAAEIVSVVSAAFCVFLLLSWAFLPVEKTFRHYLSICVTIAVVLMNLGFVLPLAAQPEQCADAITPHGMKSSSVCAASGSFIILGGWAGVMWVFLRSLSLHLQICWQVVVGKTFMWFAQVTGWGIPLIGIVLALTMSGVSFRFGASCHINHQNSLADLWIPLLVFAGFTIVLQFATFGYCIKVYLASLADNTASTEGSNLPSYNNSVQTMSPRQAYRRVRRVISLQWRGITIVLIIIADVIFFSIVFVFQDNTLERLKNDSSMVTPWLICLVSPGGSRDKCLPQAEGFVINQTTVGAVLILLGMNGIWLLLLLGRWEMVTGWGELIGSFGRGKNKKEFVSVDARLDDLKTDTRSYEMLSKDSGKSMVDDTITPSVGTPISPTPAKSPMSPTPSGRRTPDYFNPAPAAARYNAPARSFSSPRPPQTHAHSHSQTYSQHAHTHSRSHSNNRAQSPPIRWDAAQMYGTSPVDDDRSRFDGVNPLGMNRI